MNELSENEIDSIIEYFGTENQSFYMEAAWLQMNRLLLILQYQNFILLIWIAKIQLVFIIQLFK